MPPGKRELWIERHPYQEVPYRRGYDQTDFEYEKIEGYWLIPLSTNAKRTLGEYLKLYDNGKIERITLRPDDDDVTVLIKPEDK
jgi:hypothetical protein